MKMKMKEEGKGKIGNEKQNMENEKRKNNQK